MGRSPCCAKEGMNKGSWTAMEDNILSEYIKIHGEGRWRNLPKRAGLKRCGKSCRLRWLNYLRPGIKRGNITPDEEELIIRLHKLLGNRWSLIAGRLPGRTDNEIKNYWNTSLSKRLNQHNTNQAANHNLKKTRNDVKNKKLLPTIDDVPKISTQAIESNVVRTKAVRCTKVFINPQPQQKIIRANKTTNVAVVQPTSSMDYNVENLWIDHNISSPRLLDEEYKMPSDLMMEVSNMGEFNLISELLKSDFSDICELSNESSKGASDLSPSSPEEPFVLSQELLEDWLGNQ
ncbi:transcription repressor MYB6-like [Chenopodium quinoa]|uniref:Uncharacterized protein n=1 Tax=Chenopodium quinoa TaxID=63459 RepID=A0A803MG87_CHEQI|nr:transcription repressor MYB6-like [Chenopodium quinoa]